MFKKTELRAKRIIHVSGDVQHPYDVVIGPAADDNTMEMVQLYLSGILKANEAVERLRYSKINNQVSLHTEAALKNLEREAITDRWLLFNLDRISKKQVTI